MDCDSSHLHHLTSDVRSPHSPKTRAMPCIARKYRWKAGSTSGSPPPPRGGAGARPGRGSRRRRRRSDRPRTQPVPVRQTGQMKRVFVDTGAWYSLVDAKDPDHRAVAACLAEYHGRLATSNFVFDETVTLLRYRLDYRTARA